MSALLREAPENLLLVLTRKPNQAIVIGDNVRVVVVSVDRDQVRLGIEAPRDVAVHRAEVYAEINRETVVERQKS